ncbi:MAG: hypothetical protein F6K16_38450 [Symploca sp. SIO2B6]|nr:hypothetical protein [Symploca sp. SIO2B6]
MKKIKPLELKIPQISTQFFDEPKLLFAKGGVHTNPQLGITLYGPRSLYTSRHKQEVHIGFIGTEEAIEKARNFYMNLAEGIPDDNNQIDFPGCKIDRGFRCELRIDDNLFESITRKEILDILDVRRQEERFNSCVELLKRKLELLTQRGYPLDYIVFVPPHSLIKKCGVADYKVNKVNVHRDLRRAFKAVAMRFHKPTQILQETTLKISRSKIIWVESNE